jgi:ribosomal 30S subunit maturation factor RimM
LILLGKILKLKGNKGEVVVEASPESAKYFPLTAGAYILESKKYHKQLNLRFCKDSGAHFLVGFESVNSMSDAYRLIGYSLYSENEPEVVSEEESCIGYEVVEIDGGVFWGKVSDVITGNMTELLELEDGTLIPVCDDIVKDVDWENRKVYIDPPAGLRYLNS